MVDNNQSRKVSDPTRRALLRTSAVGASAFVAGCGGSGDDQTETKTDEPTTTGDGDTPEETATEGPPDHVQGQALDWYMIQDPQDVTWFGTGVFPGPQGAYVPARGSMPYKASMQVEAMGPWINEVVKSGEFQSEIYESIDIEPGEITVKLRDDAKWSNGDDVTAADAISVHLIFRLFFAEPHFDDVSDNPPIFNRAITDYEIVNDKEYKFLSSHELWDQFNKRDIWHDCVARVYWGGIWANTEQEPYDEWWAAIERWWEQAKSGEINPWEDGGWNVWDESMELLFGDYGWSAENPENYDYHWEKHFQDPDNVATTGAWTLGSINGSQSITLVPNEHHYAADQVNFDQIEFHVRKSERASRAALKSNSDDYYRGTVQDYIVESFPDDIEQRLVPANGGLCYGFNHRHKLFENREVRQAIMYAINRERIARTVHESKYSPITYAGGHGYRTDELLGQDWVETNLQSYEQDLEKADQLMNEAGFTKEGGNWVDENSEPLSLTVPTAEQTPQLAPAFADQLSQFGIDTSLQTYGGGHFEEKKDNGEFNIFRDDLGVGYALNVGQIWYYFARDRNWAENWWRVYPEEQLEQVEYRENGRPETNRPSTWRPLVIEAPPVGEPDGSLQEYHVAERAMQVKFPSSQEQYVENLRALSWVFNWHMPMFPIANERGQHFLDTAHWQWPAEDSKGWDGVGVNDLQPEHLAALGSYIQANPDNPE